MPGVVASKAATAVGPDTPVLVDEPAGPVYVSRGAHKLAGALEAFGVDPAGCRALDAGASTGGFTDLLLRRGAAHVVAVDVGYGQLAWPLQSDPRVTVLDRTNVRALEPEQVGGPVDLVVADLSFIPLGLVLPALVRCARPGGGPAADGQAAVRGRPGAAALRRSGARPAGPRRRGRGVSPSRLPGSGWACAGWWPARCRVRAATWSTSCGCVPAPRR